jgi:hypothetical protein
MTTQRTPPKVAVAIALMAAAIAAKAAPITVDFTVTSNDVSNASYGSGTTGSGYFTFDDSLIPASAAAWSAIPLPACRRSICSSAGSA